MIGVGFEPTPPKRPVPETGALDRSAIQPVSQHRQIPSATSFSSSSPFSAAGPTTCTGRTDTALVAQLVEHGSNKPRVGGSSPSWSTFFAPPGHFSNQAVLSQLYVFLCATNTARARPERNSSSLEVEHRSYEPGVAGSIPAWSTYLFCLDRTPRKTDGPRLHGSIRPGSTATLPGPVV